MEPQRDTPTTTAMTTLAAGGEAPLGISAEWPYARASAGRHGDKAIVLQPFCHGRGKTCARREARNADMDDLGDATVRVAMAPRYEIMPDETDRIGSSAPLATGEASAP